VKRQPDESAALRALRESLAEDGGGHPAEELLLAYADARSSLAEDVVERIDTHLATCASCRDEVGVLGALTILPAREASAAAVRTETPFWQRIVSALSGPVWRPALAFAVLIVLTVPVLRMVGQNRGAQLDSVDLHDNVAISVDEDPRSQEPRATTTAPAPPVSPAKAVSRVPPPPPAARADSAPSPASAPPVDEPRMAEGPMWAARESESRRPNAFAAQAMAKQRADDPRRVAPTFDYVPGGRVSIAPDVAERVTLRITLVRADTSLTDMRPGGAVVGEGRPNVVLAPTVTEVDVQVIAADGRRNTQRVQVGAGQRRDGPSIVDIPLEWLAAGENRVDVVSREERPRSIGSSFVVMLERER
jgi:hypothetical protein